MIKLVPKTQVFESAEITHPAQSGTSSVQYVINHNMGSDPDAIFMSVQYISFGATNWRVFYDFEKFYTGTTEFQGYTMIFTTSDEDNTAINVYKIGSTSTEKIRFKLVWY